MSFRYWLQVIMTYSAFELCIVICSWLCGRVKESNMIRRNALPTKISLNVPVFLSDSRQEVLCLVCWWGLFLCKTPRTACMIFFTQYSVCYRSYLHLSWFRGIPNMFCRSEFHRHNHLHSNVVSWKKLRNHHYLTGINETLNFKQILLFIKRASFQNS